ncbi:MAG: large subunit ribosomal protein [Gaiellaceae bacterium]|jgi:large subunit ribosomal protein L21|nr:large subunit ribosomal protein [Gaiellaceae bacterium]
MAATKDPYAIIALGGKQYRVREGERLLVDRLKTEEGKTFNPDVLFLGGDGDGTLSPRTQVTAKVVGHVLGEKIRIGKRRPKSGYRKQTGFRAHLSQIEIQSIGGGAKQAPAAATPAAEKETPAPKPKAPAAPPAAAAPAPAQPPRGYEDFTVADISEKSKRWKVEQLEAALKFEQKNANRKGAVAALESALAAKQEKN